MPEFIQLRNVSFSYPAQQTGQVFALRDINLDIQQGEYLAVLGHNGSGKSTLARLLNGLLLPTVGQVSVDGLDTTDELHIRDIRQRVGMVFQSPDNQLIANTVEEDVAFGPENLGIPRPELLDRVNQALVLAGMGDFRRRPPHMLSAGQKQRVAIAGILAMRPSCLILDEATAMLDPAGRKEVLEIAHNLHESGTTIIAITHNMEETLQAGRIAVLSQGQLALTGTPREIFSQAGRLRTWGLGLPPITALAHELNHRHDSFPADCLNSGELAYAIRHQISEFVP
jgi:energy-coupling factor transporter ATPase